MATEIQLYAGQAEQERVDREQVSSAAQTGQDPGVDGQVTQSRLKSHEASMFPRFGFGERAEMSESGLVRSRESLFEFFRAEREAVEDDMMKGSKLSGLRSKNLSGIQLE
jgi:hypothetical protein